MAQIIHTQPNNEFTRGEKLPSHEKYRLLYKCVNGKVYQGFSVHESRAILQQERNATGVKSGDGATWALPTQMADLHDCTRRWVRFTRCRPAFERINVIVGFQHNVPRAFQIPLVHHYISSD